jgi:hypothetical protein
MDLLKLVALDEEDLAVVSAHLQDALVKVVDIAYLPGEKRFALAARRFDWEAKEPQRRLAGLHFEGVRAVRVRNIDQSDKNAVLELLAVCFEQADAPAGTVTLYFAADGAIQIDVDYIEMQMKDLGPVWSAASRPAHEGGDAAELK